MSSRDAVLAALRRAAPPPSPLPEPPANIEYPDLEKQFAEALASVGGTFERIRDFDGLTAALGKLEAYRTAKRIVSLVPGAGTPNVDVAALQDPHELEGIDVAILPGELGVAENGAVWIPGSALGPHRAVFVVAQHLVLVLPATQIVHTMHQAYERIHIDRPGYGLFLSGPSKTADIEQALVIGAHGARSLTLFLVG